MRFFFPLSFFRLQAFRALHLWRMQFLSCFSLVTMMLPLPPWYWSFKSPSFFFPFRVGWHVPFSGFGATMTNPGYYPSSFYITPFAPSSFNAGTLFLLCLEVENWRSLLSLNLMEFLSFLLPSGASADAGCAPSTSPSLPLPPLSTPRENEPLPSLP